MDNVDKMISKGRAIVFYGTIIIFLILFVIFDKLEFYPLLSFFLSLFLGLFYYLLTSTYWFLNNVLKVRNGHELIEQAAFYLIILQKKNDEVNLLLLTESFQDKALEVEKQLKKQNKKYFEVCKYEDHIIIKSNKKHFNFMFYLFACIGIIMFCVGIYPTKYEYLVMGVYFLSFGFFYRNQKKENGIRIILNKTDIKFDNMPIMSVSKITNEKLFFSKSGISLSFKYEKTNLSFDIEQYDVKPFYLLNYIRYFKEMPVKNEFPHEAEH